MAITHITIKPGLKQLCLALSLVLGALSSKAQTYLPPPATLTATPAAGSYYSNTSITLSPTFSFAAGTGSSLVLYIVNPDCVPQTTALSANQNYILTSVPRIGGITTAAGLANRSTCELKQTVQYFDGLGRLLQTVQVKGSTALKDIVQPIAYDSYGREATKYLPYASPTADGSYKVNAISSEVGNFYYPPGSTAASGTQQGNNIVYNPYPYSITNFELSPLNRVTEQSAPGADWQPAAGHTRKMVYTNNNLNAFSGADTTISMRVTLYNAAINSDQSRTLTIGNSEGNYYQPGQLYVTISKDENWKSGRGGTIEEYTDMNGRVILKRTFNFTAGVLQQFSTYYVYDDLGGLAFVLPPLSNADNGITSAANQTTLNNLCYQYQYDMRNRLIQKRLPGKDWEYIVYNKLDQVIATQDAMQRGKAPQQWTFTKYDAMGRPAYQGIYQYPNSTPGTNYRAALQLTADGQSTLWERQQGTGTGYSGGAWPQANILRYLQINFYDNYSFPSNPYVPSISGTLSNPTGLPTASMTTVLLPDGTYGTMLWSINYYDAKGRPVQVLKQHYLGGEASLNANNYDEINTIYDDFTSEVKQTIRHHYVAGAQVLWTATGYTYDHMGRKLQTTEAIASGTAALPSPTVLSQFDYNEIGQVKTKHLHSAPGKTTFMQDIGYTYNERGWLLKSSAQLFEEELQYNTGIIKNLMTPPKYYNGNIASQSWVTAAAQNSKTYIYSYDQLNRLTSGNSSDNYNENGITYDLGGNIKALQRTMGSTTAIDNLTYTYTDAGNNYTNQVQNISDIAPDNSTKGYKFGNNQAYQYDANGNMKADASKGITNISYNLFNLPQTVTATAGTVTFTYNAAGKKLHKTSTISGANTDYIDGIQYEGGSISFIQTEEGRAINSAGTYHYQYTLPDHLGNSRLSFDTNTGTATTLQQDDYYPFGYEITRGTTVSPKNEYLYNNKELQEDLKLLDYGARYYDPVIARWTTIDPLAEVSRRWSPYNYAANNPVNRIDVDGLFDQALLDQWRKEDLDEQREYIEKNGLGGGGFVNPDAPAVAQSSDDKEDDGSDDQCCVTNRDATQTSSQANKNGIATGPTIVENGKRIHVSTIKKGVISMDGVTSIEKYVNVLKGAVKAKGNVKASADEANPYLDNLEDSYGIKGNSVNALNLVVGVTQTMKGVSKGPTVATILAFAAYSYQLSVIKDAIEQIRKDYSDSGGGGLIVITEKIGSHLPEQSPVNTTVIKFYHPEGGLFRQLSIIE